ncbi:MAG: hypothetical protein ACRC7G_04350 [Beijerinckiaceae bacterium]
MPKDRMQLASCASACLAAMILTPATTAAQQQVVTYALAVAGLPIGTATLSLSPNGGSTALALVAKVGGPFELGKVAASANVAAGQVSASSQSGAGKNATSANLSSRGQPGSSAFSFTGVTSRGPGKVAMAVAGGRVGTLDVSIPDNPAAVREPVTDAHKSGVVDPLSVLQALVEPGGGFRPAGLCGRSYGVFTGQTRFNLAGGAPSPVKVSGLPEGWSAVACDVAYTPVAGHRIDKSSTTPKPRTARVTFAQPPGAGPGLLWGVASPGMFGAFSMTATGVK